MKNEYERVKVYENCKLNYSRLATIDYKPKNATTIRKWEMIQRTTRTIPWESYDQSPSPLPIDAVEICATLTRGKEKFLVLVIQYRPPLDSLAIEFPAGLVDPNEDEKDTVIRELLEETGYHTTVKDIEFISPPISPEPGLCDSCARLVKINIDGDKECNTNPQQHLDENEDIEVVLLSLSRRQHILENIQKIVSEKEKKGQRVVVDAKLFSYLIGISTSDTELSGHI